MVDFSTHKLGRKPGDPTRPRLQIRRYVDPAQLPTIPPVDAAPQLNWPMDLNDRYGVCVVAGYDHALQTIHHALGLPYTNLTDAEIIAFYKTQNPGFPAQDDGMVIQTFLEYLTKQGKILGFASFNPDNEVDVKAATYLFHAPIIGADLRVAQQTESVWDYVPRSPDWGGHCVPWVGYQGTPDEMTCVTWGELVDMTEAFVTHQVSEAWIIITKELVDSQPPGFDLVAFAADYEEITGRPFPVVVTPPPAPPTPPLPGPPLPPKPSWWDEFVDWLKHLWP